MRVKIYVIGIIAVVFLLGLGFQLLPLPWEGGTAGLFSALWYLCALAAGLGYWHKFDLAKEKEDRRRHLAEAVQARAEAEKRVQARRQQAY